MFEKRNVHLSVLMVYRKSRRTRTEMRVMSKTASGNNRESNDAGDPVVDNRGNDEIDYGSIQQRSNPADDTHVYSQIYEQPITYESLRQEHAYSRHLPSTYDQIGISNA